MNRIVTVLLVVAGACAAADAPPNGGPDLLGEKPQQQGQHGQQGPPDGARPTGPEELFKLADTNGDGKVSKEELEAALAKQRKAGRERMFDAMDTNHDGVVSKEEFLAFEPPAPPGQGGPGGQGGDGQRGPRGGPGGGPGGHRPEPSAEMLMKHFDLNGDGFITQDEIRQVREQHKGGGGGGGGGEHGGPPAGPPGGPPAPKPGD